MSIQQIKQLCELQGITINMKVTVRCPECKNKALDINIETGRGKCNTCGKTARLGELLALYEAEELEKHKSYKTMMEVNHGVGGNY